MSVVGFHGNVAEQFVHCLVKSVVRAVGHFQFVVAGGRQRRVVLLQAPALDMLARPFDSWSGVGAGNSA